MPTETVETFRAALDGETLATVDALRVLISSLRDDLIEHVKWNAPSFVLDGEDRITLGLERKGGVRLVLHRGAKVKDAHGFRFDDPAKLARWAAPDRGVIQFADAAAVADRSGALRDLLTRWLLIA